LVFWDTIFNLGCYLSGFMAGNNSFEFKQFKITQDKCAMKVGTDAVLIGSWVNAHAPERILDVGTGTGVIALMMAQNFPVSTIDAIDIDEMAYSQATGNIAFSPWNNRVFAYNIALQEFQPGHLYDLIISNPPYFINSTKNPEEALTKARHADKLTFNDLVKGVKRLLKPSGKFALILQVKEAEIFIELAAINGMHLQRLTRVKTKIDKTEDKRLMMEFGYLSSLPNETVLVIEEANQQGYTMEYKELTREFYKNF
jgi:tRNA1Val (adenine37-N6)-methyltransferase